jgi:hypothetical protein
VNETLQLSEGAIRTVGFVKVINEALSFLENTSGIRGLIAITNEALTFIEAKITHRDLIRILSESLQFEEGKVKARALIRRVMETLTFYEVPVKSQIYTWLMAIGSMILWKIDSLQRVGDTIVQTVPIPKSGWEYRKLISKTGPDYIITCRLPPVDVDNLLGQIHHAGSVCWIQSSKYGSFHAIVQVDMTRSLGSPSYIAAGEREAQIHLLRRDSQFNPNQFNPLEFG